MSLRDRASGNSFITFILNSILRFLQLVFALAVVGLYAQDLNKARKEHKYSDGKWVYVTIVGSLSAVTALLYGLIPLFFSSFTVAIVFAWDFILFVFWCAVFGIFGNMYIHENPEMDGGVKRMKNAVWVDLVCLLLWFVSSVSGAIGFWRWMKGNRSLHTGRARV